MKMHDGNARAASLARTMAGLILKRGEVGDDQIEPGVLSRNLANPIETVAHRKGESYLIQRPAESHTNPGRQLRSEHGRVGARAWRECTICRPRCPPRAIEG